MKLQQLRFLLAVANSGLNVTAAAERLHTSQPGVSKQIKLLEEELGIELFVRKGRSLVGITDAGQSVIDYAHQIMQKIENIKLVAAQKRQDDQYVLSIATTHTQARYVLPPAIAEFKKKNPLVKLNLHQGTSEQIADLAKREEIDFAMASGSEGQFEDLLLVPCFQWDRIVLVPSDHPLAQKTDTLSLRDLAQYPLVTYVYSFGHESSLNRAFAEEQLNPDVVFTARDADVIKTYVRMGMGVGIVASMAYEADKEPDLVAIDARGLFPRSTTWIGYRKDIILQPFMQDFIRLVSPRSHSIDFDALVDAQTQKEIDKVLENAPLPLLSGISSSISDVITA